jgi:8-oxo-dGTP pyrophosphatase MutT (NUDIX family)
MRFRQVSGITYRFCPKTGVLQFLLVRSTNKGTWLFPKGGIKKEENHMGALLREVYEETGGHGGSFLLGSDPIGSYKYMRRGKKRNVAVYAVYVTSFSEDYPESEVRQKQWFSYKEAKNNIQRKSVKNMLKFVRKKLKPMEKARIKNAEKASKDKG